MSTFTIMAKIPTKNLSTKVLSARVTPDVYKAWQDMANSKNLSVSECLRDAVTMVDKKPILKAADGMVVPDELNRTLGAIGGGTVIGILLYKGIKATLTKNPQSGLNDTEIEAISVIMAMSGSLLAGMGIHKLMAENN
jgi:hypothetical protein